MGRGMLHAREEKENVRPDNTTLIFQLNFCIDICPMLICNHKNNKATVSSDKFEKLYKADRRCSQSCQYQFK